MRGCLGKLDIATTSGDENFRRHVRPSCPTAPHVSELANGSDQRVSKLWVAMADHGIASVTAIVARDSDATFANYCVQAAVREVLQTHGNEPGPQ